MSQKSFIGTGWGFPPSFDWNSRGAVMVSGVKDIEQSLEIILHTALGERFLEPDFGCDMRDQLFELLDTSTAALIEERIKNAILYHEPRIKVDAVELFMEEAGTKGRLDISVSFTVRGTNSRLNRVFPFYLQEGTEIPKTGAFAPLLKY